MHSTRSLLWALALTCSSPLLAQNAQTYQTPPKALSDLVDVTPTPYVDVSPADSNGRKWMLIGHLAGLPSIADLAQPELRLAGLRFNPNTNGPSRGRYSTSLGLQALPAGKETAVAGLPADARLRYLAWAPDARHLSVVNIANGGPEAGLSLWIVDIATAQAKRVPGVALNGLFGPPCEWAPDSRALVCRTLLDSRGPAPTRSTVPAGPVIQQNLGRATPAATFEDLLKSPQDERFFDYYATSRISIVRLDGTTAITGNPGVITDTAFSPDGRYLLVEEQHHPYSYTLPFDRFPHRVSVIELATGRVRQLSDQPLLDTVLNIRDAVETGPRDYRWRSDAPASLCWVEAADQGDPRIDAPIRDTLWLLDAPFDGAARKLIDLPLRLEHIVWSGDHLALIDMRRWRDRRHVILAIAPGSPATAPVTWFEGSFEDRYHDPGMPFMVLNAAGKPVAQTSADGSGVFFHGMGASPEGDRPFVAAMDTRSGRPRKLWQSGPPYYETPLAVIDARTTSLLIQRESPEVSPNVYLRNPAQKLATQVTFFPNPYGSAPLPKKQLIRYQRADGVALSANLYLPPGYKAGSGPLPTLMEAYPTEYKTRDAAGQVTDSPFRFPLLSPGSPVPFAAMGYAVLENTTIPIVGEGKTEPNDTYVEQLVASAKAAIDEGVRLGVVDRARVAVMGHSYGAFMTANLLAHSDLFKAGIARSGAYNRTLTPFGFQNEERTYWQAPQVYYEMSPFSFADKIKTPILLIHGEADDNTGTFPVQSERLFDALKGQGGTVRFVLLPLEAHGYAARESILHMFWEMNNWLSTYVKDAPVPQHP